MGSHISTTTAPTSSSGGLTADERWSNISKVADEYLAYLATSGGVILTAETRLQVAQIALDALECPGCASLPKGACLRKGHNI